MGKSIIASRRAILLGLALSVASASAVGCGGDERDSNIKPRGDLQDGVGDGNESFGKGPGGDGFTTETRVDNTPTDTVLHRTPWQMHNGLEVSDSNPLGLIRFDCSPGQHGEVCEYDVATIPTQTDADWLAAPDGNTINFRLDRSRVCDAPVGCMVYGDFTYFQTLVNIPPSITVTQFSIAFDRMDDGSRITVFNSAHPSGLVVPGSYVYLGGSGTSDLSSFVISGEVNRVVVTQVDDCCSQNQLGSALVVLNGESVDIDDPNDDPRDGNWDNL